MEAIDPRRRVKSSTAGRRSTLRPVAVVALVTAIAIAAVWWAQRGAHGRTDSELQGTSIPASAVTPVAPVSNERSYVVRRGDTFGAILGQFGVIESVSAVAYRELRGAGLPALFPGDSMVVDLGDSGRVERLSILSRLQYWYRFHGDRDTLRALREPVPVTVVTCIARGTLLTSLSEDMWLAGEGDGLVGLFTDIFAWDINFFTDPRVGDEFEVLFEKRYAEGRSLGYGDILAARYLCPSGTFTAVGIRDSLGKMRYYDTDGNSVQKQFLKAPLRFSRVSSGFSFSRKHPVLGIYRPHLGVDYAAPRGTPVHASADGVVVSSGWDGSYGNQVTLRHGAAWITSYGHLASIAGGVRAGTRVAQGQMIGTVGSTGLSSGPHLDYRMKVNGRNVNPLTVELPSGDAVSDTDRERFERSRDVCMMTLGGRFVARTGSWVVEVRQDAAQSRAEVTTAKAKVDDGNAAGG